jgi:hypothetical protein
VVESLQAESTELPGFSVAARPMPASITAVMVTVCFNAVGKLVALLLMVELGMRRQPSFQRPVFIRLKEPKNESLKLENCLAVLKLKSKFVSLVSRVR